MKIAEIRSRLVALDELLEDGDVAAAHRSVRAWLSDVGGGARCPVCGATFEWPGVRDDHVVRVHPVESLEASVAA